MLEARSLSKRYHGVAAVAGVSFTVRAGEVVGYLGPNGSGKSTTVKMLTTLLEPSSGAVLYRGTPVDEDPVAFRRQFGYVPEEPHLYSFLTGRGYLELVGGLRGIPHRTLERRISTLLGLFGMADAGDQDIAAYSKGMKQKVVISAALLHNPPLMILDEPESGLDVTTALILRHLVRRLADTGKAILYSSHVLESVEKVATRVVILHAGHIVADDSVENLRLLQSSASLEEAFSQLALGVDPSSVADEIVQVIDDAPP